MEELVKESDPVTLTPCGLNLPGYEFLTNAECSLYVF